MIVMKIVVTGSLGYVSKPLAEKLIEKGHSVTVISSSAEKQALIAAMGAKAAIGSMEDVSFLMDTFSGADAVYCMLAPYGNFADPHNDAAAVIARAGAMTQNYVQAIERSGVKRVVYLSSIGADMEKGAGLILIHHRAENILGQLPPDVNISFMRPSGFYKNLYAFIGSVKNHNRIAARYGGDDMNVFVSNLDIADAIVEQIESQESGRIVRYVASEEMTCNEAAAILGAAIGKPDLNWVSVDDKEQLNLYKSIGMNDSLANQFVEMNNSIHNGRFFEDYSRNKPAPGKVKLKDFAKEFAVVYQQ
jgi:uncharacterized protein YbjT (DUF2867 family)